MGLLGKKKKKGSEDENSDAEQPLIEAKADDDDRLEDIEEISLELDGNPVEQNEGDGLELNLTDDSEEKAGDDDDPFGGDLMDIFGDDDEGGMDMDALADYLDDVEVESLLAQATHVTNRLRGLE